MTLGGAKKIHADVASVEYEGGQPIDEGTYYRARVSTTYYITRQRTGAPPIGLTTSYSQRHGQDQGGEDPDCNVMQMLMV